MACGHYWYICKCAHVWNLDLYSALILARLPFVAGQVRLQTYRSPKYDSWMARIGRAPAEDTALVEKEAAHDARAIHFQEVAVDGLRHSDWLVSHAYSHTHNLLRLNAFPSHAWQCFAPWYRFAVRHRVVVRYRLTVLVCMYVFCRLRWC